MQHLIRAIVKAVKGNWVWFLLGAGAAVAVLPLVFYGAFWGVYRERILPGVRVVNMDVGGMSRDEAMRNLASLETDFVGQGSIDLSIVETATAAAGTNFEVNLDDLGIKYDPEATVDEAISYGRGGGWVNNLQQQWLALDQGVRFEHKPQIDEQRWTDFVSTVSAQVNKPGVEASVRWVDGGDGSPIQVFAGEDGTELDGEQVADKLMGQLKALDHQPLVVALSPTQHQVSDAVVEMTRVRAEKLLERQLTLNLAVDDKSNNETWTLKPEDIVPLMQVGGGWQEDKIADYVDNLALGVNREPQNALFKFESGKVTEFAPGLNGVTLEQKTTKDNILKALEKLETADEDQNVEVVAQLTPPELSTPDVNSLGIKELLGHGDSTFFHSIAGRIHNVALTANRLNGVLVPPGETFSFNQTIGDVSAETGYQSAYVIKDGRTILGDGGGVCQDSTTLFRALLDAGLPIVERQAHAYRVGYYEQNSKPGFDATVYAPSPDLKFKNDTPGHILIQATADTKNLTLVIELYGTSDGRKAEIKNYQQWGAVPAPPPLYQDDPTIPAGTVKQVDWAAPGLKVKFDYEVTRGGETIFEKTFTSNYRPWQAVYLRGV